MEKDKYFLIHNSDGDTTIRIVDKNVLLKELANGDYGSNVKFIDEIDYADTNYWGENTYLIIKGNIVSPQPEQVVTKFKMD